MLRYFALISLTVVSAYPQWKWLSNDLSYPSKKSVQAPVVPHQRGGHQHSLAGPAWVFDKAMARDTRRFEADALANGIPYSKSGYRGSARLYSIEVAETGVIFLNVMTNGGSGDVDIYVRRDEYPTKRNYDMRSAHPGNQEQVIIDNPRPGRYYIVLYGFDSYNSVGFEAEYR